MEIEIFKNNCYNNSNFQRVIILNCDKIKYIQDKKTCEAAGASSSICKNPNKQTKITHLIKTSMTWAN